MTPVILLAPGSRDWSYDFTARALVEHLSDRFDFRIAYGDGGHEVHAATEGADVILEFWWGGRLEQHYGRRVVKQVSSHRWDQRRYGSLSPHILAKKYLEQTGGVVVPSRRLLGIVRGEVPEVMLCSKGFDPSLFFDRGERTGDLRVGWAGNAKTADKRLAVVAEAWPALVTCGMGGGGPLLDYEQMPGWYNTVDVITCASDAEGDPRTLIEGMACGCFPVTVDVGIVPEIVRHGENGLIVERAPEAFRAALQWCAANVEQVRAAGRENAQQMLASRTWAACAPAWGAALDRALARREST